MGKAVRPKSTQQLPSMGSRGRARGVFRRRLMIFVVILFALLSAGAWWGISQITSTENRSQASVDRSFRLRLVPNAGEPAGWETILSARSNQASVKKVSGAIVFPQDRVDASVQASAPVTTARKVHETPQWIVTTTLPESVKFTFTEADGTFGFTVEADSGILSGEPSLFTLWSRYGVVQSARSLWLLEKQSIRGFLLSSPGIELELFSKEQKRSAPKTTACVSVVKSCPKLSAVTTTEQYPCGACLDKNGNVVGPNPPSPIPAK